MSSSDSTSASGSPFAPTVVANSNTLLSIFETKSDMTERPGPTPTGSRFASIMSQLSASRAAEETTFSTSTTTESESGITTSSTNSAQTSQTASATTQSSTSTRSVGLVSQTSSSNVSTSAMSKPGIQAAVAIPIVIFVLAIIGIIFCCLRRRKKRISQDNISVEKDVAKNKKWTRHFRVFSFDNELLMGGRYSSTNSVRSRQTGSLRSNERAQHAATPSIHSVEEVAPAYRDAVHTQPNIVQAMAGGTMFGRSESTATAPPPYAGRNSRPISAEQGGERHNPFADSPLVSPIEGSPFNDPPGTTSVVSRNSSLHHSNRDDVSSIAPSDAASIREATMARNASVISTGRVIQNVKRDSQ